MVAVAGETAMEASSAGVTVSEAAPDDQAILGHLLLTAGVVARKLGLSDGFRLVINNGRLASESVPHLHVHLLAKRPMRWPHG